MTLLLLLLKAAVTSNWMCGKWKKIIIIINSFCFPALKLSIPQQKKTLYGVAFLFLIGLLKQQIIFLNYIYTRLTLEICYQTRNILSFRQNSTQIPGYQKGDYRSRCEKKISNNPTVPDHEEHHKESNTKYPTDCEEKLR